MNRERSEKGSGTVEFVLSFFFVSMAFLIVVEFILLAISVEVKNYGAFMANRSLKIGSYANLTKECEDNPIWNIKGGESCPL